MCVCSVCLCMLYQGINFHSRSLHNLTLSMLSIAEEAFKNYPLGHQSNFDQMYTHTHTHPIEMCNHTNCRHLKLLVTLIADISLGRTQTYTHTHHAWQHAHWICIVNGSSISIGTDKDIEIQFMFPFNIDGNGKWVALRVLKWKIELFTFYTRNLSSGKYRILGSCLILFFSPVYHIFIHWR